MRHLKLKEVVFLCIMTVGIILFAVGCGAQGSATSTNDGSNLYEVDLSSVTVPLQNGGEVECVVAQSGEAALSCNWAAVEETP